MKSAMALLGALLCACAALADGLSYGLTNCWRISEFAVSGEGVHSRTADFSFLKTVKKDKFNAWTNGVSIDSFYAYSSTGACNRIRLANEGSYLCGIYAAVTNGGYALSILGIEKQAMELVLPLELDGKRDLSDLAVGYDVWQFTGNKQTTLTLSVCAVDELVVADSSNWIGFDVYTSGVSSVSRLVRIQSQLLNGTKYLCLRWSVPRQGNSSMLGISDLRVSACLKPEGTLLLIR